jgi:hypothetical protein
MIRLAMLAIIFTVLYFLAADGSQRFKLFEFSQPCTN